MPCYSPLHGFRSRTKNPSTGKRSITFTRSQGFVDQPVDLPCGQCIGCRLERSRQWAVRCLHESSLYDSNCFITLTYRPESLPLDGSLDVRHFQLFMKRLRRRFGDSIRFFHCGEYGEKLGRPHYHALLFNFDFPDRVLHSVSNGMPLYRSAILDDVWSHGHCLIGDVTFESAAYVARYITKKITGDRSLDHYTTYDRETGEIFSERKPEYVTMSRKPGIGRPWLDKFLSDVYPDDFVILRGKKVRPPKYYDSQFSKEFEDDFLLIKGSRKLAAGAHADNNTFPRLRVREHLQLLKFKQLIRGFENGF